MRLLRRISPFAVALLGAVAEPARAQPLSPGACAATGTLADLISYGTTGCIIGDKLFKNFQSSISATGPGTAPTDPSQVTYALINRGGIAHGFSFTSTWFAPAGSVFDQSLRYQVWAINRPITDVHLNQFGDFVVPAQPGSPAPTGFISVNEDVCAGGQWVALECIGGQTYQLDTFMSGVLHRNDAFVNIVPSSMVDIVKDIRVVGGNTGAGFSIMDQYVTQTVPEPSTYAMFGVGALTLAAMARRRRAHRV